jgi:hypothetical protein
MERINGKWINGSDLREAPSRGNAPQVNGVAGHMGLERAVVTRRTGLYLPPEMPFTTWQRIGRQIYLISDSSAWWWGDWLVFGEDRYPDRYRRAIAETSLEYQTLRNYAWVARRFPISRRRDRLSFQHHVEVAAQPEADQEVWLTRAEQHGWSRNELRRQLRKRRSSDLSVTATEEVVLRLNVDRDRQDRWREAATLMKENMSDWIVLSLDRSAAELLDSERASVGSRAVEAGPSSARSGDEG